MVTKHLKTSSFPLIIKCSSSFNIYICTSKTNIYLRDTQIYTSACNIMYNIALYCFHVTFTGFHQTCELTNSLTMLNMQIINEIKITKSCTVSCIATDIYILRVSAPHQEQDKSSDIEQQPPLMEQTKRVYLRTL